MFLQAGSAFERRAASPVCITVAENGTARLVDGRITVGVDAAGCPRFLRSAESTGVRASLNVAVSGIPW